MLCILTGIQVSKMRCLTFMIKSGLNVPTPAIPIPAFAVPYAAPAAATMSVNQSPYSPSLGNVHPKIIFRDRVSYVAAEVGL
jgi:hypothetical protein